MFATLASCGAGVLLGMRHALEPDHLAAVSTLAAERGGRKAGFTLGAFWGTGHALSLMLVAGTLVLIGAQMPPRLEVAFEGVVGLAVIGLGIRAVSRAIALGRRGPAAPHLHGAGGLHTHEGPAAHVHISRFTLATRPLLMGVLHGLAGSGALTALVVARMDSTQARLLYVLVFALGSVAGMSVLTGTATFWLKKPMSAKFDSRLLASAGFAAIVIGAYWGISAVGSLVL